MTAAEQYIQVAADADGKKVRNLELDILQPDGTVATVEMQVVAIAGADGRIISSDYASVFNSILEELRRIRLGLQLLTENDLSIRDSITAQ